MENSSVFDDDSPPEPKEGWLLVRIHVPELNVYKCLQFPSDRLVWDVKQQVLSSLPKVSEFQLIVKQAFCVYFVHCICSILYQKSIFVNISLYSM